MDRRAALDWQGVSLLAVLGRGKDGLVDHVISDRPLVRRLLVLDPDPAAANLAVGAPPARLAVIAGLTGPALETSLRELFCQVGWLRHVQTLQIAPPPDSATPSENAWYSQAIRALKAAVLFGAGHYGNDPADALEGLRNVLGNLTVIQGSADLSGWRGLFAGRPAVVASAGPSLPAAFDALRAHQDRLLIVAPDTSLKPLLAAGIRPHIITSKERSERTIPLLEGVDAAGITLAALPLLPPRAFDVWTGDVTSVFGGAAHFPWLGTIGLERDVLPFDGSAGNMAFKVCEALGCDPIILVGQDLSFSDSGETHAAGTDNAPARAVHLDQQRLEVPGNRGGGVSTTPLWLEFLQIFETDVHHFLGVCLNATQRGARIRGAPAADLNEVLEVLSEPFDARAMLDAARLPPPSGPNLYDGVSWSILAAAKIATTCEESAAFAEVMTHSPPSIDAGPWDMNLLLGGPLAKIGEMRASVVRHELFHELITPIAQSSALQTEMAIYGLPRNCQDPAELVVRAASGWAGWFRTIGKIARVTESLLKSY